MYVYILGGFLGSGKTTLLIKLASMYAKRGQKTAIIVNEAGDFGVDGSTLKANGYDATELPNGCICCTLAGSLRTAMLEIEKDMNPDVVLIEPTGLAMPSKVKDIVQGSGVKEDGTYIIGLCDLKKFNALVQKREQFFKLQLQDADFILMNKADLVGPEDIEKVDSWIRERFPGKKTMAVSIKDEDNMAAVYDLMR